ncbi:hypothetical protein LUZ61_005136 [Rhynchospora tenuis]|uniref:Peptidase S59 domain-containing protein n=1 Tax=Rhynchospora tenuis TaxID=198213 RepID=A0AAD5ZP17_9POAL|nr:hypothetical protein LUZ61_005136 [Rhynchospora tenuis]
MFGQMGSGVANPFGSSNANPFGGTSTSANSFGQTTGSFGGFGSPFNQLNPFTGTGSAFGFSNSPAFGSSSGFSFGTSSSPAPGASGSFLFSASSAPAFGTSSSSAFVFGSTSTFSSSFSFGVQAEQQGGSKNEAYKWTARGEQSAAKVEPAGVMPVFKDPSHQEWRWPDYQRSDKDEPNATCKSVFLKTTPSSPFGQTASNPNPFSFTSQSTPNTSPFSSISQSNADPCSSGTESNPKPFSSMKQSNAPSFCFTSQLNQNQNQKQNPNRYSFSSTSQSKENQYGSSFSFTSQPKQNQSQNAFSFFPQSNPNSDANSFSLTSQSNQNESHLSPFAKDLNHNLFSSPFAPTPSPIFSSSSTSSSNMSVFGSVTTQAMCSPVAGSNAKNTTQVTGLTQCTTPAFGQQSSNGSQSGSPSFGQSITPPPTTAAAFVPTASSFQAMTTGQISNVFSFGNNSDAQTSQGGTGANGSNQPVASQTVMTTQATPSVNLFGGLPSAPQLSVGLSCTISSVQYGISSLPIGDKSASSRGASVPRHLSQRRVRLPLRRYHTKTDASKVAFYAPRQEALYAPKLDPSVIPRLNPRKVTVTDPAIVNNDDWLGDEVCDELPNHLEDHLPVPNSPTIQNDDLTSSEVQSDSTVSPSIEQEEDLDDCDLNLDENDENAPPVSTVDCNHSTQKGLQAAIVYEHGAEIEALMPKLRHADFYTEPRIQDLAARERADPGFCSRVPGFVVGRTGYGCIKFLGETDVRKLDLEAIVQFGNREVVVYRDEKKKPVMGQGLNKPAEVALLNVKCINKKTGERYLSGPKVERYKEMLAKKTAEQGGEFLSYDPVKAEWRFKVMHFSRYGLLLPPR